MWAPPKGSLPAIIALVAIWGLFFALNENFLSAQNLTNLILQVTAVGTISVGVVLVLLLGEIDLSVGAVSGLAAAVMAVLSEQHGVPAVAAIASGLLVGAAIGTLNGLWVARLRVPSFVVTLAGLLAWQGALLLVLGSTGTLNLTNETTVGIANTFLAPVFAWLGAGVVIALVAGRTASQRRQRRAAGLPLAPPLPALVRIGAIAVVALGAAAVLAADRGLPLALVIFLGLIAIFALITTRTRFGRHMFAIGGDVTAARRAGIQVNRVRVAVFALTSTLAAAGGILAASRLLAVNQSSGGGDILLNAIAGAVIGGTSLFGGRGSVWSALIGALVIGSVSNGMDLLAVPSSTKYLVTGSVLLVAATIDALSRRTPDEQEPA